ncbi:MAG TPA: DUF2314 domain-containing protein [Gemmataceae bacterium]|nr:DUF2314 domain-containing protein [Gemmataceae bacterium]
MARRCGTVAAVILLLAGCGKKAPVDKVTPVAHDDPRMNAAMAKARSIVGTFISALQSPKAGQSGFSVKMEFTEGKNVEHMWLTSLSYDGRIFQGTVNNQPAKVKSVKIGQTVTVERAKISDWMFIENRKLVGGYTLRALRETLPPDERANFDKSVPFVID